MKITRSEAYVINVLLGRSNGLSAEAIAKTIGWTLNHTYAVLAQLQKKGIIKKYRSPHVRYGRYAYKLAIPYTAAKKLIVGRI